jgi:hypothetical protein
MNFLSSVTRVLRANGVLRGDTDAPTTFSDLQHGATINLAQLAIQDELNELTSDRLIPYEKKTTGSIATVQGTRSYALATDFIRLYGTPLLYCSADNRQIFEYPGGEDALRLVIFDYATQQGDPIYWYFEATTSKKISFFPVPQSVKTWTYHYEGDVSVTNSTDTLPFHNEQEAQAFCRLASRRFKFLYEGMDPALVAADPEHMKAKATLINLMKGTNPTWGWAPVYL